MTYPRTERFVYIAIYSSHAPFSFRNENMALAIDHAAYLILADEEFHGNTLLKVRRATYAEAAAHEQAWFLARVARERQIAGGK